MTSNIRFGMAPLFILLLTAPLLSSAFLGGGLFGGGNGNLSYALGLQAHPNFQLAADVGAGAAGAIDAGSQAFVNGVLGIGGSMIDGAAEMGKAGLTGAAGMGGALGGVSAGAASAAGKAAASLGGFLGSSFDFGMSGNGTAQLQTAFAKYLATSATSGAGDVLSAATEIAKRCPFVRAALQASGAISGSFNGTRLASFGPLGSIGAGVGVKKSINGTIDF